MTHVGNANHLSDETLQKARRELKENPSTRNSNIQAVRDLCITRPDIQFTRTDDDFIVRFLRARKSDPEEAFKLFARYYELRQSKASLFNNLSAEDINIRQALLGGFPGVLDSVDPFGRKVLVLYVASWEEWLFSSLHILRAVLLSVEYLLEDENAQINGFVVIVDWSGVTFKQASHITPAMAKLTIELFQDSFPARLGGLHMVNQPWYVEAALTVCKPFLKESTRKKVIFHGNNLVNLHTMIHKEALPTELGGLKPPYNNYSWAKQLIGCNFQPQLRNDREEHQQQQMMDVDNNRPYSDQVATLPVTSVDENPSGTVECNSLISLD